MTIYRVRRKSVPGMVKLPKLVELSLFMRADGTTGFNRNHAADKPAIRFFEEKKKKEKTCSTGAWFPREANPVARFLWDCIDSKGYKHRLSTPQAVEEAIRCTHQDTFENTTFFILFGAVSWRRDSADILFKTAYSVKVKTSNVVDLIWYDNKIPINSKSSVSKLRRVVLPHPV